MNARFFKVSPFLCGLFLCLLVMPPTARAQDNAVLQWDQAALQAVRNTRMGPRWCLAPSRSCIPRCMTRGQPTILSPWAHVSEGRCGGRHAEHVLPNKQKAISFAAYRTLVDLFPASQHQMFALLMNSLGYDPNDNSTDTTTPAGIGNVAANAVIAFRHGDGSNQLGDLNPGAYTDYTGYQPVNSPDDVSDLNRWQPLRLPSGQVQTFLAPHWERVVPFALTSASQFRPALEPAPFRNRSLNLRYWIQAIEILVTSARLRDREKTIAEYWSDGPATETPPGHWCLLAQQVSRRDGHSLDDDVKMYFALTNATPRCGHRHLGMQAVF